MVQFSQHIIKPSPIERAIERIWNSKGKENFETLQDCSFGSQELDFLIKSDFLGKLNNGFQRDTNPNAPSILQAAGMSGKVLKALEDIDLRKIKISPISEFIITPKDVVDSLKSLAAEIAWTIVNPRATPEFVEDLKHRLDIVEKRSSVRVEACKELIELSESTKIGEQASAGSVVKWIIDSDRLNYAYSADEGSKFRSIYDRDVIFATIKSAERLPLEIAPSFYDIYRLAKRNSKDNDNELLEAAARASQTIQLKQLSAIIEQKVRFPKELELNDNVITSLPAFRGFIETLSRACLRYNQEDRNSALEILKLKPKLAFESLKSAFETAMNDDDTRASNLLEIMHALPRQRLRMALYLENFLIVKNSDSFVRDMIVDNIDKIPKAHNLMAKLWSMVNGRREK